MTNIDYKETQNEPVTLYGIVKRFLEKQSKERNIPINELYITVDLETKEIDLKYEDDELNLYYLESYKN